jgi:hypothetical protein
MLQCMMNVFGPSCPFQINETIVGRVAVLVVYLVTFRTGAKEGFGNKTVDEIVPGRVIRTLREGHATTSIGSGPSLQYPAYPSAFPEGNAPHVA